MGNGFLMFFSKSPFHPFSFFALDNPFAIHNTVLYIGNASIQIGGRYEQQQTYDFIHEDYN